ncbi:uncharacterized protein LOC134213920 [Armigeres subalbatus]|uniref:uncharacterized protein LOC134213920 n=1 Tax=Armigeres subalbatus TaxID=124917 RepID=UPI002ED2E138
MSLRGFIAVLLVGINVIAAGTSLLLGLLVTGARPVIGTSVGLANQLLEQQQQQQHQQQQPQQSPQAPIVAELPQLGLLRSLPVATEPTPNAAANIINLDRDGGVSFIPRKDFRPQRAVPAEYAGASAMPHCESFTMGNPDQKMLYSPGAPGNYPNNSDCVVVLEAPVGSLVRLDFRDHFHIEPSEECKYDFLEIRDGAHGFSTLLGKYCGTTYPPMITSKERFLWLRFHSDENIEYSGFVVVYEYVPRPTSFYDDEGCRIEVSGMEGFLNRTDVPREKQQTVIEHGLALDCMWVVTVQDGWKIQLSFLMFKLEKPNDCESNFVDVFTERTDLPSRLKNFCGSIADSVVSKSNVLHIRFFTEASAINSTFSILFTAFREKAAGETCDDEEYDCEDATCISSDLRCNGRINCRFRWDEDECHTKTQSQSEHVTIIMVVFGLIFGSMVIAFVIKIVRKIIRDHKIIREHIRQSRESKLNELGRHSTKKPVDLDITKFPPPAFDKEPINVLENAANSYYREVISPSLVGGGSGGSGGGGSAGVGSGSHMFSSSSRIDMKNDPSRSQQEIQDILRSSYHDDPLRAATMGMKDAGMCDMACQTRESLFQPVFKNKITQSPNPNSIRFSTFGYEAQQPGGHSPPTQLPSVTPPPPKVKHHHHHHHHHHTGGGGGGGTLDRSKGNKFEMQDLSGTGVGGGISIGVGGDEETDLQGGGFGGGHQHGHHHHHHQQHLQQPKVVLERDLDPTTGMNIRKSAPDVIIMTSSH